MESKPVAGIGNLRFTPSGNILCEAHNSLIRRNEVRQAAAHHFPERIDIDYLKPDAPDLPDGDYWLETKQDDSEDGQIHVQKLSSVWTVIA